MSNEYQYQPATMHPASSSTALVERNEMTGTSLAHTSDQTNVLAQQAIAAVQARYVLAVNRPRNLDYVRQRILHECHRPTFARVAKYTLPYGDGVSGPTIRFAEMVIRNMGNLYIENMLISDTPETRVVRVVVTDLETNASYYKDITIAKTVERSSLRRNQTPIKTRHNSLGKIVYIVEASEGDLLSKEAAQVSKAIRTCALRLIPGDILDEALAVVDEVLNSENAKDPDAARKRMVDTFAQRGITAEMLAKYLGMNDLSAISPQQITHLQGVYYTISDGEATWADIYAASPYRKHDGNDDDPDGNGGRNTKAAELQKQIEEKLKAKKAAKKPAASTPKPTTEDSTAVAEPKAAAKPEAAKPTVKESVTVEQPAAPEPEPEPKEVLCDAQLKGMIQGMAAQAYGDDAAKYLEQVFKGKDILTVPRNEAEMVLEYLRDEAAAIERADEAAKDMPEEPEAPEEPPINQLQKQSIERLAQILYPENWQDQLNELRSTDSWDGVTELDGKQILDYLQAQAGRLKKEAKKAAPKAAASEPYAAAAAANDELLNQPGGLPLGGDAS